MSKRAIKLLLVDDHTLFLDALTALFKITPNTFDIVGHATDGLEAIKMASNLKPDVILMDLLMPKMNGNVATCEIMRRFPESKIIILSISEDQNEIVLARQCGAAGYILKNTNQQALIDTIYNVMSDNYRFVEPIYETNRGQYKDLSFQLTRRERQIFKLLFEGGKNRDIADLLTISVRTVEKHRANIMKKLNNPTPAEQIKIAKELGITFS